MYQSLESQLKEFKSLFLSAPEEQLDDLMKKKIREWGKVPTVVDISELLERSKKNGMASGFAISIIQMALNVAVENESANAKMSDAKRK